MAPDAAAVTADTLAAPGTTRSRPASDGEPAALELPRYRHRTALGQGGMGRVDRVHDLDLVRDVAIKQLRGELCGDPDMIEQFLWEARVTARLDHPHIVPVHDLGSAGDGRRYFTMKLVRGVTLEAVIAGLRAGDPALTAAYGLPRRLRLFLQLCNAIGFAHARGVLHRDLKPANVMVGEFGELLVTDWGLALPLPGPAGDDLRALLPAVLAERSAGTPSYMSPEQARGEPLESGSDQYTLGLILYELVALRRALDGGNAVAVMAMASAGEMPPLATLSPGAPAGLAAVIAKATATDPADRYPDVSALAADIETVLDGRAPAAEHASLVTQAARYYLGHDPAMRRLRVVDFDVWVGGSALVGAGIGAALGGWIGPWWWTLCVLGLAVAAIPTRRWLRFRREHAAGRGDDD